MPITDKTLAARDAKRDIGEELLEVICEVNTGNIERKTIVELLSMSKEVDFEPPKLDIVIKPAKF